MKTVFALWMTLAMAGGAQAQTKTIQVDFGGTRALPAGWNNGQGMIKGGASMPLSTSTGEATSYRLVTVSGFNGLNQGGTTSPAASLAFPVAATVDSFFANGVAWGTSPAIPLAVLEVRGLNPALAYRFQFFASRLATDGQNRETQYTARGATTSTAYLNATNNSAGVAAIAAVQPNASGTIVLEMKSGPKNSQAQRFYYLGSMKVSYAPAVPTPVPTATPRPSTPTPTPTPVSGAGQITIREKATVPGSNWGYGEYLPAGYATSTQNYPVLLFMHGMGECVGKTSLTNMVNVHGPIAEMKRKNFNAPMVVLEPQSSCNFGVDTIDAFLNYAFSHYRLDARRLYVTGLSMGGGAVATYLDARADKIAAAIPLSASGEYKLATTPRALIDYGVALWGAVAKDDAVVPPAKTINMLSRIFDLLGVKFGTSGTMAAFPGATSTVFFDTQARKYVWLPGVEYRSNGAAVEPPYLLTYYASGGHSGTVWGGMYGNSKIYEWLMLQSKP